VKILAGKQTTTQTTTNMKAKTIFGMMVLMMAAMGLCQCGSTTPAQKQAIAVQVGEDVLADVAAGAPVLLTGNTTGAVVAAGAQEVKNLAQLQATVGKVLQATPVSGAANVVNSPVVPANPAGAKTGSP
jgi:hypothetical protein